MNRDFTINSSNFHYKGTSYAYLCTLTLNGIGRYSFYDYNEAKDEPIKVEDVSQKHFIDTCYEKIESLIPCIPEKLSDLEVSQFSKTPIDENVLVETKKSSIFDNWHVANKFRQVANDESYVKVNFKIVCQIETDEKLKKVLKFGKTFISNLFI